MMDEPREETAVESRELEHVCSMMTIDRNPPPIEEGELGVVSENLGRRRAGILHLYTTIRYEYRGIHRD